jgi:hypothetical protein
MTTIASHPGNELDNPFDDIDDSSLSFDNDPIVIELVALCTKTKEERCD